MNLPHFQTPISLSPINPHQNRLFSPVRCYFRRQTPPPKQPISIPSSQTIPPRDRVIDFGKFKGKMLGTLPSTYLKWISKNLRARDFEEWANLADQVLRDPFYKDRIEWEFAENILNGNRSRSSSSSASAVPELLEISERFGWDNDDKSGWGRIDFELLGTSKGGRIPRLVERSEGEEEDEKKKVVKEREGRLLEVESGVTERRKERRERKMKMKMKKTREGGGITRLGWENEGSNREVKEEKRGSFVNGIDGDGDGDGVIRRETEVNGSPFPGREALLRKVANRRRFVL